MADLVELQFARNGVARIILNRTEQRNALSLGLIAELRKTLALLESDDTTRVVVLSANGPCFCAGADVGWMCALIDKDRELWVQATDALIALLCELLRFEKTIIAQVNGTVAGGGVAIAATCDMVIATDDTRFFLPELNLGMVPSIVAPFLIAKLGPARAKSLLLEGRTLDAYAAMEIGLVSHIAAPADIEQSINVQIQSLLEAAPDATAEFKRMFADLTMNDLDRQVAIIRSVVQQTFEGAEAQVGIQAFLDKSSPHWIPPKK